MAETTPVGGAAEPKEVVRAVMDGVSRLVMGDHQSFEQLVELYADPAYVLHPMRPEIPPAVTHEDLRHHLNGILERVGRPESYRPTNVVTHFSTDPEVVITEFAYEIVRDAAKVMVPCVWVTRVRGGQIVEARDYNGTPISIP